MTPLRRKLRKARAAYELERYPADLAATLLPANDRQRRTRLLSAALGGVLAACVGLAVMQVSTDPPLPPVTPLPQQLADTDHPAAAEFRFPDRLPVALPSPPLIPATPAVTISWGQLNDLGQQHYGQIAPRLRQHLRWPGLSPAKSPDPEAIPTTQNAV